ncbi:MAG: RNA polymerase sigma factor [Clostridia bacterium]|nr:RNA polymerase sigma factor [Clostridia bacterium]
MLSFCLLLIDDPKDKVVFEKLYYELENDVLNYAYSFVHNKNDAEDISQDTWFCAAKRFATFRTDNWNSVRNYIIKITHSRVNNFFRKRKRNQECLDKLGVDYLAEYVDYDVVLNTVCENFEIKEIKNCINMLPQIYKDVLNFYILGEFKAHEIADMLGLKRNTVNKQLARGSAMLASLLKERGIE